MPTIPRLFLHATLHPDAAPVLPADQAHYLVHVLRRGAGDPVIAWNGRDGEWAAALALAGKRASLAVRRQLRLQTDLPPLALLFAPPKRDATETIARMATELGVTEFVPVITGRTQSARPNLDRLRQISVEAAEQCERLCVPAWRAPEPLAAVLAAWPPDRRIATALERADAPPPTAGTGCDTLLVGPEGGFSPADHQVLARHGCVMPVTLGALVLRADTAVVAGLARLRAM